MPSDEAIKRMDQIDSLYRNEELERKAVNEMLKDMGVEVPDEKKAPFEKVYFNGDMLAKYEPCMDALTSVIEAEGEDDDAWKTFESTFSNFMDFSWISPCMAGWDGKTRYDIVFYGVSGYTGYLTMEYLKRVALKRNPEKFTFAFAGRTASKIAAMRDREFTGTEWADTPILSANYDEPVTMIDLAKSARCILNVAGPYMLTPGEIMLDACCYAGTHYVDINGEIPWFFRTLDLDKRAKASNTIICPSAAPAGGVPDLLVYLNHKQIKQQYGEKEELRRAVVYSAGGGAGAGTGGGTLATRNAMTSQGDWGRKLMADPFALYGFIPDRDRNGLKEVSIKQGTGEAVMRVRKEDNDAALSKVSEDKENNVWRLPQTYAYFDTRVVRRTNALLADYLNAPYGRRFNFTEYMMMPKNPGESAPNLDQLGMFGNAAAGGAKGEKETLEKAGKYYKQGEGPPLEDLGDVWTGWFCWVESENEYKTKNCYQGNDGYFETARCSTETCMSLVFDYDQLPIKGGAVTMTAAAGDSVCKRLIASGIKFRQGEWLKPEEVGPLGM